MKPRLAQFIELLTREIVGNGAIARAGWLETELLKVKLKTIDPLQMNQHTVYCNRS